jgi:uncharacterized membrane protein
MRPRSSSTFVLFVILFQILTDVVVHFDVPIVRQVIGFIYLTFIPGLVLIKAFKLNDIDLSETLLLSVGLDIAVLMFAGFFLNGLLFAAGFSSPLSSLPILVTMNGIVLVPCLWIYLKGKSVSLNGISLPPRSLLFIAIPVLSILGVLLVNGFQNNFLLLLMLGIIAGLVLLGTVSRRILPAKLFPIAILAITIALLLHSSLITNYIVGWDIHSEYHAFRLVDDSAHWNSTFTSLDDRVTKGYATLSVTILPTVYSKIADVDATLLLKLLYPLLLSFVPLALYKLYSVKFRKEVAFLSAIFLVSNLAFFGTDGFPAKQMIGELFYVLLFLVIFKEKIGTSAKAFFFTVFSAGLVVSNYSMSYIFMFLIFVTWILVKRMQVLNLAPRTTAKITLGAVLIFFAFAFAWYIFTSATTLFNALVETLTRVSQHFLTDFFDPTARTATVLRGLGAGEATSLLHVAGRIFFYSAELFIALALVVMLLKKEYKKFGYEYAILTVLNCGFLIMGIVIPNFARYFRMERFYQISLLFLAPFFVLGGESVFHYVSGVLARIFPRISRTRILSVGRSQIVSLSLVLMVLIPFFLFETGFIYEISKGYSYSLPLSMYRMNRPLMYERITDAKEVASAVWLSNHLNASDSVVYSDLISMSHTLVSYGMLSENLRLISNTTKFTDNIDYVYLRGVNTKDGLVAGELFTWNISDIQPIFGYQNAIYSNDDCQVLLLINNTRSLTP